MDYSHSNEKLCGICCENFNKSTRAIIVCPRPDCEWKACKSCVRTFLLNSPTDPSCMKCFNAWDIQFMVSQLNRSFWTGDYKKHRRTMLLESELSKMPDTMTAATQFKEAVHLECEIDDDKKELSRLRGKMNHLTQTIYIKERRVRRINRAIDNGTEIDDAPQKKFLMNCSYNDCRGYLSTQYKCEICERFTCSKCLENIGTNKAESNHVCNEDNIKSAEMVKKDTKPCPNCASRIYKIDGCDQMFCTTCHTAFSWNTGSIVTGVIHNPHYYEWQRYSSQDGNAPRVAGDVACGGLINHMQLRNLIRKLFPIMYNKSFMSEDSADIEALRQFNLMKSIKKLHRSINHVTYVSIQDLNTKIDSAIDNKRLRIDYILGIITKDDLKVKVYKQDMIRAKSTELRNIWQVYEAVGIDLFNTLCNKVYGDIEYPLEEYEDMFVQIREFISYCNKQFGKISVTYHQVVPKISDDFYEKRTKYKIQKKPTDGSGGGDDAIVEV